MFFKKRWIPDILQSITTSRYMLFYIGIMVLLAASSIGTAGFAVKSPPLLILGVVVWLIWFGLMFVVASPPLDKYFKHDMPKVRRATLIIFIILVMVSLGELFSFIFVVPRYVADHGDTDLGKVLYAMQDSFRYNDSTALVHQAADNLLEGKNPYAHPNVVQAMQKYNGSFDRFTPLAVGRFAGSFPYPAPEEFREVYDAAVRNNSEVPPEFENEVCYPAGAFLLITPFIAAGIDDVRIIYVILLLLGAAFAAWKIKGNRKFIFIGAALISIELWNAIVAGDTGSIIFPLLIVAWLSLGKNDRLSAIFMGLAIATKQIAWFVLPFYLILLYRRTGFKNSLLSAAVLAGVFVALNLYFIIQYPGLWLHAILSPMSPDMFPLGGGYITLVTGGFVPAGSSLPFTIAEVTVFIGCIIWYYFNAEKYPHTGPILAILPLFFAWRSIWNYFFYVDLVMLAGLLADDAAKAFKNEEAKAVIEKG
ncbi:MAG: hypothetical protein JW967_05190 [Dehalococcoidales bacterium]|nr:hypothetical protein [Dehalococcoidales bacterium]